jgi:hypothetical protein
MRTRMAILVLIVLTQFSLGAWQQHSLNKSKKLNADTYRMLLELGKKSDEASLKCQALMGFKNKI